MLNVISVYIRSLTALLYNNLEHAHPKKRILIFQKKIPANSVFTKFQSTYILIFLDH